MESAEEMLAFLDLLPDFIDYDSTFIWNIKNFQMCPDKWGKQIKSPEFSIYNLQNPKFRLLLYAGGVNEKSSKYISLYIVKTSFDDDDFTYSCRLGIITSSTEKMTCYKFHNCKLNRGNGKGLTEFFELEKLQHSQKDTFLPNGNLTIFCELAVKKPNESMDIQELQQLKELSNIYAEIYNNQVHSDVFLQVGYKIFKVHKAILQARFPDLLKNMIENKCNVEAIDSTTMKALLHYIYTGILNVNELNLFEIISSNYVLPSHLKRLLLAEQDKIKVTTCFQKKMIYFSWDIQNFSSLDSNRVIHYPIIGDYNIKWTWFAIFLSGETDETGEAYVTISIQRFSKDCRKIFCAVGTSEMSKTFDHTYDKDDKWTLPKMFTKDLLKTIHSDETSDTVSIKFEIAVTDGSKTDEFERKEIVFNSSVTNQTTSDLKCFKRNLLNVLSDPKFCDSTIISGKQKFPAHKFILCARSTVFCDMFQSESAKAKNSEIILDDIDPNVIKDMLNYMYYNEISLGLDARSTCKMYSAASKYNLSGLKVKCTNRIKFTITDDSAGDILISADQWDDKELKELVYNFVCTHPLEIANSKEWEEAMLKRSDLVLEIMKKALSYLATKTQSSMQKA